MVADLILALPTLTTPIEKFTLQPIPVDAIATDKTAEGSRGFAADIAKVEKFVASKIN